MMAHTCNTSRGEAETGGSWGLIGQSTWQTLCLKKKAGGGGGINDCGITPVLQPSDVHAHTYTRKQEHRHKGITWQGVTYVGHPGTGKKNVKASQMLSSIRMMSHWGQLEVMS